MKTLILASVFSAALFAQAPANPNVGVWHVVRGLQNANIHQSIIARVFMPSGVTVMPATVCSVPLLEANAKANDPGVASAPKDHSAEIPKAHVPAPACPKP
jgi:hypothetical protein